MNGVRNLTSPKYNRCVFAHDHVFIQRDGGFASRSGLPQSVLERYADAFGEVDVICRAKRDDQSQVPLINDPRIKFYPVKNLRSISGLLHFGRVQREIDAIVAGADCVIARLPSSLGLIAAASARRQQKPYAVEVVGNALEANLYHGAKIGPLIAPVEHYLCKMGVKRAPMAIYITEEYLQKVYPTNGKKFICPNVSIDAIISQHDLTVSLNEDRGSLRLGLVGSLDVSYKGHDTAISALAILKAKHPGISIQLDFVGGGNPARWRRLADASGLAAEVSFVGVIPPGAGMRAWYDTMHIMLQPSQVEAQGRSIIEAMSRGRPVIGSRVGGIPELLSPDCLVNVRDADGIADIVSKLILNREYHERISRRNRETAGNFTKAGVEQRRNAAFEFLRSI